MSQYIFQVAVGRKFDGAPSFTESFLLSKRTAQSYHYFFIIMGSRPINLIKMLRSQPLALTAKQSAFGFLTKLANHYTHTAVAMTLLKFFAPSPSDVVASSKSFIKSLLWEYDARDRREYIYFARFFASIKVPEALAILIGVPPQKGDAEYYEGSASTTAMISPFAASQDSFKRHVLYEVADLATSILFAEYICPKYNLKPEEWGIEPADPKVKIVRTCGIVVGGELGAFVGRAIGNSVSPNSPATAGAFEFWFETVGRYAGCPVGTNLGNFIFA